MPTDDPTRLREALDGIANALQPAVIVAGQLQRASAATAQDAAVVEGALARAVTILKDVQRDRFRVTTQNTAGGAVPIRGPFPILGQYHGVYRDLTPGRSAASGTVDTSNQPFGARPLVGCRMLGRRRPSPSMSLREGSRARPTSPWEALPTSPNGVQSVDSTSSTSRLRFHQRHATGPTMPSTNGRPNLRGERVLRWSSRPRM